MVIGVRPATAKPAPVREAVEIQMETLLAGAATGGKQRLTGSRVHRLLIGEGVRVGVTLGREPVKEQRRR